MTPISPTALEAAAKALRGLPEYGKQFTLAADMAEIAITAYLAQREKEGFVEVPVRLARKVTSIARRNEDAPEITELSTLLAAAQNGSDR